LKQAFTFWSFVNRGLTPAELFKTAAKIGYRAVELVDEELFPEVKKAGLELSSHRAFGSIERGLNRKENHAGIFKEFEANLKLASQWKIPGLIGFSGNRDGLADDEAIEVIAEGLSKMGALAAGEGVSVWLELLNSKRDHPDYQCDRTSFGVRVIEAVNASNVKLLYDIYHMQVMEGDIIETINTQNQHFGHYHTAGNPGRNNLDNEQELNYPPIFRAIQATAYTGCIAHEFIPKGDVASALKEAFDLCETALS
jgi:hydroxypyruvate isomerase